MNTTFYFLFKKGSDIYCILSHFCVYKVSDNNKSYTDDKKYFAPEQVPGEKNSFIKLNTYCSDNVR